MTTNRPLRVFLCHSSADKAAVRELYHKLRAEPWIDPWLDEEKLLGGQDIDLEINKATRDADAIIICLSTTSVKKEGYVNKEIRRALDIAQEKPDGVIFVIPLRINDCIPSFEQLKKLNWVDYFLPKAHEKLLQSLQVRALSLGLTMREVISDENRVEKKYISDILKSFSSNLDEITKNKSFDYSARRFLAKIKFAPPFLDIENSILQPEQERKLAEHFSARDFIETNREIIKGGGIYKVKKSQISFEKIAEDELGNGKYASQIRAANPGVINTSTGQRIYFPYIDISDSLGLSSEQIGRKFEMAQVKWIEPTLKQLISQFNLMEDSALDILEKVYRMSKKPLDSTS